MPAQTRGRTTVTPAGRTSDGGWLRFPLPVWEVAANALVLEVWECFPFNVLQLTLGSHLHTFHFRPERPLATTCYRHGTIMIVSTWVIRTDIWPDVAALNASTNSSVLAIGATRCLFLRLCLCGLWIASFNLKTRYLRLDLNDLEALSWRIFVVAISSGHIWVDLLAWGFATAVEPKGPPCALHQCKCRTGTADWGMRLCHSTNNCNVHSYTFEVCYVNNLKELFNRLVKELKYTLR